MKNLIGAAALLLMFTGCACSRESKKEVVLRKALQETRVRYDYAVDQNERYSQQNKKLVKELRKRK